MKKNLSILAVIFIITLLAACGTSNEAGEKNTATEQTSGNESNVVNEEEEAPNDNGTEQNEEQESDKSTTDRR